MDYKEDKMQSEFIWAFFAHIEGTFMECNFEDSINLYCMGWEI